MQIQKVINSLKDAGCSGKFQGGQLTIKATSWNTFKLAYTHRKKLALCAYVKDLFSTAEPVQPIDTTGGSKCSYCKKLMFDCPYEAVSKIPAATFHKGCELWEENKHCYF